MCFSKHLNYLHIENLKKLLSLIIFVFHFSRGFITFNLPDVADKAVAQVNSKYNYNLLHIMIST